MTKKELIKALQEFDDDTEIVINSYFHKEFRDSLGYLTGLRNESNNDFYTLGEVERLKQEFGDKIVLKYNVNDLL